MATMIENPAMLARRWTLRFTSGKRRQSQGTSVFRPRCPASTTSFGQAIRGKSDYVSDTDSVLLSFPARPQRPARLVAQSKCFAVFRHLSGNEGLLAANGHLGPEDLDRIAFCKGESFAGNEVGGSD